MEVKSLRLQMQEFHLAKLTSVERGWRQAALFVYQKRTIAVLEIRQRDAD